VFATQASPLSDRLKAIYGSVDNVDASVGMVSEKHVSGTDFGSLQLALWTRQFTTLRNGDRFFYAIDPVLKEIQRRYGISYRVTLAKLIALNTKVPLSSMPANVFFAPPPNKATPQPGLLATDPRWLAPGDRPMSFGRSGRLSGCTRPQEDLVSKTTTRISKISTVVIPVSDQDRAIEFYVETLGFEKRTDVPFGNGYRWVEVAPGDAVTTIAIVPPPPDKPTGSVETGIALQTDDIDAEHADLKARGVDVDPEVSRMGDPVPPLFWFRDPDGNTLMVVENR
jgi:catechol 2,3-dioxygenase-like lactoylglutathione lyase family enzyme